MVDMNRDLLLSRVRVRCTCGISTIIGWVKVTLLHATAGWDTDDNSDRLEPTESYITARRITLLLSDKVSSECL